MWSLFCSKHQIQAFIVFEETTAMLHLPEGPVLRHVTDRVEREKSPSSDRIQTHDFSVFSALEPLCYNRCHFQSSYYASVNPLLPQAPHSRETFSDRQVLLEKAGGSKSLTHDLGTMAIILKGSVTYKETYVCQKAAIFFFFLVADRRII